MGFFASKNCGLQFSRNVYVSQLFEDPEASGSVFLCAIPFVVVAAAAGVEVRAAVVQPGTVATVHVFEAHHIIVLHRGAINSVSGEDLESDPAVAEPVVSCYGTDRPTKTISRRKDK